MRAPKVNGFRDLCHHWSHFCLLQGGRILAKPKPPRLATAASFYSAVKYVCVCAGLFSDISRAKRQENYYYPLTKCLWCCKVLLMRKLYHDMKRKESCSKTKISSTRASPSLNGWKEGLSFGLEPHCMLKRFKKKVTTMENRTPPHLHLILIVKSSTISHKKRSVSVHHLQWRKLSYTSLCVSQPCSNETIAIENQVMQGYSLTLSTECCRACRAPKALW